jgi:hypothetical protein
VREKIEKLKKQLREIIEPDIVFLNQLITQGVLTEKWRDQILNCPSEQQRNDELLNWLLENYKGDFRQVLEAFEKTGQKHVVNYIMADGGMSS